MANDNDVKIVIHTEAQLSALKETRQSLADLRTQLSEGSIASKELEGYIGKLDDAIKGGVNASVKEAGEHIEHLGHVSHETHMALRILGGQIGEFGHLLHFIFSPELLGLVGFVIALKMVTEQWKEHQEQLEKVVEWNKKIKESAIESHDESMRALREESAAYDLRLKHQFDSENFYKEAAEQRLKMYDAEIDHVQQLATVESNRFSAYIKYLQSIGQITPQQASEYEQAQKQREADAKEAAEEAKKKAAIKEKLGELGTAGQELHGEQPYKLAAARAAEQAADEAARNNQKIIKQEQDKFNELDAAAKVAEAKLNNLIDAYATLQNPLKRAAATPTELASAASLVTATESGLYPSEASLSRNAAGLRGAATQQQGQVDRLTDRQTELQNAMKAATAEVKKWEDKGAELNKAISDLTFQINNMKSELAASQSAYAQLRAASQPIDAAAVAAGFAARGLTGPAAGSAAQQDLATAAALFRQQHAATGYGPDGRETVASDVNRPTIQSLAAAAGHIRTIGEGNAVMDALTQMHSQYSSVVEITANLVANTAQELVGQKASLRAALDAAQKAKAQIEALQLQVNIIPGH